jgi:hypothetical protein
VATTGPRLPHPRSRPSSAAVRGATCRAARRLWRTPHPFYRVSGEFISAISSQIPWDAKSQREEESVQKSSEEQHLEFNLTTAKELAMCREEAEAGLETHKFIQFFHERRYGAWMMSPLLVTTSSCEILPMALRWSWASWMYWSVWGSSGWPYP